ncbi:MAG TPA: cobalamin biosynthesis protein CbiG [Chloroflexia bacterium]|nr:cobalamin biosynthesis protein CbiG [Chloroflexia bacterium]
MPGGRLFDAYLAVDWSARNLPSPARPSADALWVGEYPAPDSGTAPETYWRTRHRCIAHVRGRLLHHVAAGRRVLLGFDFPYGYPAGYAAALALPEPAAPWRRLWDALAGLITDDACNGNNRFTVAATLNARCGGPRPGPLWGCPRAAQTPHLAPTSPAYPFVTPRGPLLARTRHVEQRIGGHIQPCWKLLGTGSVGGQALVGIPRMVALRDDPALAAISRVWPFETGFGPDPLAGAAPGILHAEIWPGIVPGPLDASVPVRDQAQVRAVVQWMAALDATGDLGSRFVPPAGLTRAALAQCVAEEGWLLGA